LATVIKKNIFHLTYKIIAKNFFHVSLVVDDGGRSFGETPRPDGDGMGRVEKDPRKNERIFCVSFEIVAPARRSKLRSDCVTLHKNVNLSSLIGRYRR